MLRVLDRIRAGDDPGKIGFEVAGIDAVVEVRFGPPAGADQLGAATILAACQAGNGIANCLAIGEQSEFWVHFPLLAKLAAPGLV